MMLLSLSGLGAAPDGTRGPEGEEGGLSRPRRARPEGLAPCGPAALGYESGRQERGRDQGRRAGSGSRRGEDHVRLDLGGLWETRPRAAQGSRDVRRSQGGRGSGKNITGGPAVTTAG